MKAGERSTNSSQEDHQADTALFRKAMRGVEPLMDSGRVAHEPPKPKPVPRPEIAEQAFLEATLSDNWPLEMAEGREWSYARPGFQRQGLRKLRSGHWQVQAELDLHGLTREAARRGLITFLEESVHHGYRCVRIIHGKGYRSKNRAPVLKTLIGGWLAQCETILAFCQARQEDGGSGALLVLLRKSRTA